MRLKLILGALLIGLGLSSVKADTVTPNLGLTIPDIHSTGWGDKLNANFVILDSSGISSGGDNIFVGFNTFAASVTWTAGNIVLPASTADNGNIYMGTARFRMPVNSVFAGENAGNDLGAGQYQVCFGAGACSSNNATSTIGIGFSAASGNTGSSNIAIGENAMGNAGGIGAGNNIAIGRSALTNLTNPPVGLNIAIGSEALEQDLSGFESTVIGYQALKNHPTSTEDVAVGIGALQNITQGIHNTAVGSFALNDLGTGGAFVLDGNVAIGHSAGGGGDVPVVFPGLTAKNVGLSVFIGDRATVADTAGIYLNSIAIGHDAHIGCSNCTVIGATTTSTGAREFMNVGIGISSPTYGLEVNQPTGIYSWTGLSVGSATIRNLAFNQCVQTDGSGNLASSGGLCGSGGGGGSGSPLEIMVGGVRITSPTLTIGFGSAFTGSLAGGSTAAIALNASSVTLQGNIFNGTSQLVKTTAAGLYPALDGSLITNIAGISSISIYPATATASFPLGFSASTATYGSATATTLGTNPYVTINASGTSSALTLNITGNPGAGAQTQIGAFNINSITPTGPPATHLVSVDSTTDAQLGYGIWEMWEHAPSHNDPLIWIHNDGNSSNPFMRVDDRAPDFEMINTSTDNAHGRGKWEPFNSAYQSARMGLASRAWDNTTFESVAYWEPLSIVGAGLYLNSQTLANDSGVLASSDTLGINFFTQNNRTVGLTGPLNTTTSWTFALPSTPNNQHQILYQTNNGRGNNNNARQWEFTIDGTAGQVLSLSATSTPTWVTPVGSPGGSSYSLQYRDPVSGFSGSGFFLDINQQQLLVGTTVGTPGAIGMTESAANGSSYVAWKASESLTGSTTWIMPDTDGLSGDVLTTLGSVGGRHVTKWATPSGGSGSGALPVGGTYSFQYKASTSAFGSGDITFDPSTNGLRLGTTAQIEFFQADNVHYVGFKSTTTGMVGSTVWTLPAADGTAGQVLTTTGGLDHALYWATNASTSSIQNTSTLQAGSTFYVSSGTVKGNLNIQSTMDPILLQQYGSSEPNEANLVNAKWSTSITSNTTQAATIFAKFTNNSATVDPLADANAIIGWARDVPGANGVLEGVQGRVTGQGTAPEYAGGLFRAEWISNLAGGTTSQIVGLQTVVTITNGSLVPISTGTAYSLLISNKTGSGAAGKSWAIYSVDSDPSYIKGNVWVDGPGGFTNTYGLTTGSITVGTGGFISLANNDYIAFGNPASSTIQYNSTFGLTYWSLPGASALGLLYSNNSRSRVMADASMPHASGSALVEISNDSTSRPDFTVGDFKGGTGGQGIFQDIYGTWFIANHINQANQSIGSKGIANGVHAADAHGLFQVIDSTNGVGIQMYQAGTGNANQSLLRMDAATSWVNDSLSGSFSGYYLKFVKSSTTTFSVSHDGSIYSAGALTASSGTITYGLTVGSITTTGSGAGSFTATEGVAPSGVSLSDVLWGDSTAHWFKFNPNNGQSYLVMGSSSTNTTGNLAVFSANGSLIDGGANSGVAFNGGTITSSLTVTAPTVLSTVFVSSTIVLSTGTVSPTLATRGWIAMTQDTGVVPLGLTFHSGTTGARVAYLRKQLNGNLSLINEDGTTGLLLGTNATTRMTIGSGGQTTFTGGITGNGTFATFTSSVTVVAPVATPYGLTVSTSSAGPFTMTVSTVNHVNFQDFTSSPTLTSCGTGPTIIGSDMAFEITPGATAGGCIATFAQPYTKKPICVVDPQTLSLVNALSYTVTNTAVTITQTALTSVLGVHCFGRD